MEVKIVNFRGRELIYFAPGSIVRLNSGSANMLVLKCENGKVVVCWGNNGQIMQSEYPVECVSLIIPPVLDNSFV